MVSQGRFATPLHQVFSNSPRRPVLLGLTRALRPYVGTCSGRTAGTGCREVANYWAEAQRPSSNAAPCLHVALMTRDWMQGYRERAPTFAQRAVLHFVTEGLSSLPYAGAAMHRDWVAASLARQKAPSRPQRTRLSDQEIMVFVERHFHSAGGIGGLLRALRHVEGIACEQTRFARLYRAVISRRTTA